MKSLNLVLIALVAILTVACADEKKASGPLFPPGVNPNGPYIPPGSGPGLNPGTNWEYGGTADLLTTNQSLNEYLGWPVNTPSNVRINLNLREYTDTEKGTEYSGFGGVVTVAFENNGIKYEDTFSSLVNPYGMVKTNGRNNSNNIWFNKDGRTYWHGFFQDHYGAIVIVIDEVVDLGDGQGPEDLVSGEIWFKNHQLAYAPLSPTSCWFVSLGPYDCRTWKSGNGVDPLRAIYPDPADGYRKLGEFIDLSIIKAFNQETN